MPGSNRTFEYTLKAENVEDTDRLLKRVERILGWACEGDDRITCHGVSGEAIGIVTINLTVRGRDQWWSRQLAQDIVNLTTWGLANSVSLDLRSFRQEAHEHRGYQWGRSKRYREPRPPSPPTPADGPPTTPSGHPPRSEPTPTP